MENKKFDTAIEAISANITETQFENFDDATVDLAKQRVLDVLGCAIGGANAPGNKALLNVVGNNSTRGDATIWIHGIKSSAQDAAMVNTIMNRSYDFEVMSFGMDGQMIASHHASTNVPTAISLAESLNVNGRELLTAMILGDDTAARIAAASAVHPIKLGWDGCGTLSHLGATAIAGRLLGLDRHQMKHAFGIVLNQIASAIQSLWDGATTFKLGQGTAAKNGIFSAELARAGWTGVIDALQSRFGYFAMYAGGCSDPDILTRDLGKTYYGEAYFKPYPCGLPNHVAIKSALSLMARYEIDCDRISKVIINVPSEALENSYYAKPFELRDFPHGDAIFSYPFTVATTLLYKSCGLPNFSEDAIRDPKVVDLTSKTELIEPDFETKRLEITLKVIMNDGTEYTDTQVPDFDWVKNPIPKKEIEKKFWHQVEFSKTVSPENAEELLLNVGKLEQIRNIQNIIQLLCP